MFISYYILCIIVHLIGGLYIDDVPILVMVVTYMIPTHYAHVVTFTHLHYLCIVLAYLSGI